MQNPLEIDRVEKSYGGKKVLNGVSVTLREGEIVGLIGVNGAGKSTLLKAVLDLHDIDAGTIRIFSKPHRRTESRRSIAYLGEQFTPPYYATGADVLRLLSRIDGKRVADADVEQECAALELDPFVLDMPSRSYSKGMLQKLGLISCLINQPPLLILDEPMSGLDPLARRLFKDRLTRQRSAGCSIFFSTHLLEDVESVCDRVVVLDDGVIQYCGSIDQLLTETQSSRLEDGFLALVKRGEAN